MERPSGDHDLAEALAKVSRALQSEPTAQETLQKIVELAVATVHGCDHAGITMMKGRMWTPAATALGRTGTCPYARLDERDGE